MTLHMANKCMRDVTKTHQISKMAARKQLLQENRVCCCAHFEGRVKVKMIVLALQSHSFGA